MEAEMTEEKIINEGTANACATIVAIYLTASRVQDMEEERAVPLRYDPEHSSGVADTYDSVASRYTGVRPARNTIS